MNSNNLFQLVQTGFRATLGATTALIESVQDSQKREQNLALLGSDFNKLVQDLAAKGEITEQEARIFVDTILNQQGNSSSTQEPARYADPAYTTPVAPPDIQLELQELTIQIAAIRAELEKSRE